MISSADLFLKKALGEDFMESLQKFELWKPGTKTTIDHEELKTALQIVPRTVIAMLIKELAPMEIGQTKDVPLFVGADASMNVTKHERDVYSGDIKQNNKVVVDFKFRSLPGIGLVIMSAFELYDMDNLINAPTQNPGVPAVPDDITHKVQRLIDERLELHSLIDKVVDRKIMQRDAVHNMLLLKLTEELKKERKSTEKNKEKIAELRSIAESSAPQSDPYFRGMTNGIEVINATIHNKEPNFVEVPKPPRSPIHSFLETRKKKGEYSVHMAKGETVDCPDCGKNIFNGQIFSGCICLGDDMERKVFIKKSEDGIKVRFSKGWDQENIEMLLEVLRNKHG